MKQLILFISYGDKVSEYVLPGINDRKYEVGMQGKTGIEDFRLSLQVWDGKWYILSNEKVRISQNHMIVDEKEIHMGDIFNGKIRKTGFRFMVRVGELNKEQAHYIKLEMDGREKVEIGQHDSCDIVLCDSYVSQVHAIIYRQNGQWYLYDQSRNGTYVNQKKVAQSVILHPGDQIDIVGFRIVFLEKILAINQIDKVKTLMRTVNIDFSGGKGMYPDRKWFSRAPRFMEPLDAEVVEIEGPPALNKQKKTPLFLTIGPSLTMPIPILLTVLFQIAVSQSEGSSRSPLSFFGMIISVVMFAALGVMWTMLRNRQEENAREEEEVQRETAYRNYIGQNEKLLQEKEEFNRGVLERNYPAASDLAMGLVQNPTPLWNRNINHEDFLTVRVGVGDMKSPNELVVPKQRFSVVNDPLVAFPNELKERYETIARAVKLVDLKKHKVIGIIGEPDFLYRISDTFLVETAAYHSYTDVKMIFLVKKGDWEKQWRWVKWLPHTFSKDKKIRYIVSGDDSYEKIVQELMNEIKLREESKKERSSQGQQMVPHYLVFVSDREMLHNSILYQYMISPDDYGITFLLFYGKLSLLPNECKYIIERSEQFSGIYMLNETIGKSNMVEFEIVKKRYVSRFARMISGQMLQEIGQGEIPDSIDYLSLLGIGNVEQWNLMRHYKENRSFEGMKALIGVMSGNKPMYLDIHEKKHGPHGLIAGTTGSGKSETIQTFILSLALNYHPSEVAFILIDYKGGGMANLFQGIPHVAGIISNLDEEGKEVSVDQNQTRRALQSIRSELKRREQIFNKYKVNHIDAYMRLYREGKAEEPLPHLIIISDEFAELKKEQPEFIKELVSTARVGRSIGVHLILATQKPAGVVDEEIFSNSRFKICLRVQDKTDSMEMLKRPEAAYLSTTGRAYFQMGNNELFEMFQSGYSGALYESKETQATADDEEVMMIELDGTPSVLKTGKREVNKNAISQLEACIRYIKEETIRNHILAARALWLPSLPKMLYIDQVTQPGRKMMEESIVAYLGLIDDPEHQSQYPFSLDFAQFSNLIVVGNQGCGKSTFIQTMLYSLVTAYDASEINLYAMDFSSGMMRSFLKLPHCGGVAFSDEEEKVKRMLKFLLNQIKERTEKMKESGVGSFWEYKKINQEGFPMIFFVLDNYFEFTENYEAFEGDLVQILRNGAKCGIQTIISMNRLNDMRYKLRQNITKVIPLSLSDKMDYVEALGKSLDGFSAVAKGRGLVKTDQVLEFQTALVNREKTEFERIRKMEQEFLSIASRSKKKVEQVRTLPENPIYEDFLEEFAQEEAKALVPLGYERETIVPYYVDLKQTYCYLISSVEAKGAYNALVNMYTCVSRWNCCLYYINTASEKILPDTKMEAIYSTAEDIYHMLILLKEEFTKRNRWRKEHPDLSAGEWYKNITEEMGQMIFFIDDFSGFLDLVYQSGNKEPMYPITELFFQQGKDLGIHFIAAMQGTGQGTASYRIAFKNFVKEKQGIHIGGRLDLQKLFQFTMPSGQQMKRLPDNVGHMMTDNREISLLIPWNKE